MVYLKRLEKVRQKLKEESLDAIIIDKPVDLYYLTGQDLSLGRLLVTKTKALLYVDGRYFEGCKKKAPLPVHLTSGYEQKSTFAKEWKLSKKRVGFDANFTSFASYQAFLPAEWIPLKSPIQKIREIKDAKEIKALRKAAKLGSQGFDYISKLLKVGITEKQVAIELELYWRKKGGEKIAFEPQIAFGEGSAYPHYHASDRKLKKGDIVLIDIGVVCDHYHSDMTRVLFFGKVSKEIEKIYQIVKEAQKRALEHCMPGTVIGDLDHVAREYIKEKGYGDYFPHSLGHGVGLEIHESPLIRCNGVDAKRRLKEGMVITIEPGIYLPGVGGVRLEDTVYITKNGYENLTNRPLSLFSHSR